MLKSRVFRSKELYFPERLRQLMGVFERYPLILIEAPMGYGKTTFVRESLQQVEGQVLWLKNRTSDLKVFWIEFCRQLGQIDEMRAEKLSALGFPRDSSEQNEATQLIEAMGLKKKVYIVIDDYHLVANKELNVFFERLVLEELNDIVFVLIGRYSGMEAIDELKLKAYALHVKKDAFEFSPEEIKSYFQLCGIRIGGAKAEDLFSLTEGWISALYLILLDYVENDGFGITKDIGKLIENAIYAHFSEDLKKLMLSLCLFDSFTLKQAEFMVGSGDVDHLLSEVIAKNGFVTYDSLNRTYQIHRIFADFLQEEMEKKGLEIELFRKAAHWYLQIGSFNEAFEYFYRCEDYEPVLKTFNKQSNYSYDQVLVLRCCRECPDDLMAKYPFALLVLAFELYTYNEMELFSHICEKFTMILQENASLTEDERDQLMGEFELLLSFTQYNDVRLMAPHFTKASELLNEPSQLLPQNGIWTFGAPSILYMFYRESGKLEASLKALEEVLPLYSNATNGNANAGEFAMKAEVCLSRGDLENALITCHQGLYRAAAKNQISNTVCIRFVMARIALMKGQYIEVLEQFDKMRKEVDLSREYLLHHSIEICEGYLYALHGKLNKIPLWLQEGDFSSDKLLFPNMAMINIVYGRVLLLKGEYHQLIGSMDAFLEIASVFPNILGQIYTYVYVASAHRKLMREQDAQAILLKALELAMADQLTLPFVENCDFIQPILEDLQRKGFYAQDIEEIFKQYESYQESLKHIEKEHFSDHKPKLTEREMEICQLVVQGLTNKEIAEKLYITVNTVKMALKSIYGKLGINSRTLIRQNIESLAKSP